MSEIPIPSIVWPLLNKMATWIYNRFKVDIEFEQNQKNPEINIVTETAYLKYKLIAKTYGMPKFYPRVIFSRVRSFGSIKKKTLYPNTLGHVDESLLLKLNTHELPSESEIDIDINFEIDVNVNRFIILNYLSSSEILDSNNNSMRLHILNNNIFPLEQIHIIINKEVNYSYSSLVINVIDNITNQPIGQINNGVIRRGDEYIKWPVSIPPNDSIIFEIITL